MAKQKGIIQLEGTIGNITFYKSADGYIAKENAAVSADKIFNDPSFQRTRENMAEFGRAGKAGKLLRNAIRPLLQNAKDRLVTSRLTAAFIRVIQADATSARGQRNVIDGEAELLEGFNFNANASLGGTVYAPFTVGIDRVAGNISISIPAFIPAAQIAVPSGTTHFKIAAMGAELDFENETFNASQQETAILPWDNSLTAPIVLAAAVSPASTHSLFAFLGIQFYQSVNGTFYSLKDGGFNALALVNVNGV